MRTHSLAVLSGLVVVLVLLAQLGDHVVESFLSGKLGLGVKLGVSLPMLKIDLPSLVIPKIGLSIELKKQKKSLFGDVIKIHPLVETEPEPEAEVVTHHYTQHHVYPEAESYGSGYEDSDMYDSDKKYDMNKRPYHYHYGKKYYDDDHSSYDGGHGYPSKGMSYDSNYNKNKDMGDMKTNKDLEREQDSVTSSTTARTTARTTTRPTVRTTARTFTTASTTRRSGSTTKRPSSGSEFDFDLDFDIDGARLTEADWKEWQSKFEIWRAEKMRLAKLAAANNATTQVNNKTLSSSLSENGTILVDLADDDHIAPKNETIDDAP